MSLIGSIEHFQENQEEFQSYLERLEHLFKVNAVENDMKVSMFITLAGAQVYSTLKNLVAPRQPDSLTYEQVKSTLKNHYAPAVSVIGERFRFNKCMQKPNQSISNYIVEIKKLAASCNFGEYLNDALRDRLVCGINSEAVQKKLLSDSELTFERACTIALSSELADNQVRILGNESINYVQSRVQKSKPKNGADGGNNGSKRTFGNRSKFSPGKGSHFSKLKAYSSHSSPCYRCGRPHNPESCPAANWECFLCHRKGHTSKMCRSRSQSAKHIEEEEEEKSANVNHCEIVASLVSSPAFLNVVINGRMVEMEIDTGASISVMSKVYYDKYFKYIKLQKSDVRVKTVTGDDMKLLGSLALR